MNHAYDFACTQIARGGHICYVCMYYHVFVNTPAFDDRMLFLPEVQPSFPQVSIATERVCSQSSVQEQQPLHIARAVIARKIQVHASTAGGR